MASDLPPGFELDEPPAGGGDIPAGFKLDEPPVSREREIRLENLKKLMAMSSGKQNLSGLVTGEAPPVSAFSAYTNRLKDAWTSGLARPMGAAMTTATGEIGELFGGKPATLGERWRGGIGAEEDYAKAMEEKSKGALGTGVSVLGSLASAGRGTGAPLTLGREMLRAGTQGTIEGVARNAESVGNAVTGGATGGVTGAGVTGVTGALLDRLRRVGGATRDVGEASRGGTSQTLASDAGAIFDRLDNAGMHFSGRETPALANSVNAVTSGPLPASVRGEIDEVVQDINRRVANGAMTFGDVRAIQSEISKLRGHMSPDVRRVAGDMGRGVDDFLTNARPTMPASSVGTVGPGDLAEARRLYATSKHAGKVEGIAEAAVDPKTSVADPKATASAFKSYKDKFTKNTDKLNPNTPDQRRLIDEIVTTGKGGAGADRTEQIQRLPVGYWRPRHGGRRRYGAGAGRQGYSRRERGRGHGRCSDGGARIARQGH